MTLPQFCAEQSLYESRLRYSTTSYSLRQNNQLPSKMRVIGQALPWRPSLGFVTFVARCAEDCRLVEAARTDLIDIIRDAFGVPSQSLEGCYGQCILDAERLGL
jgi:hypothetical protein